MTNQANLESADTASPQGVPTPAGGVVSGQPPSNGAVTFTAEQWAQVEVEVEKRVQSLKDRRLAKVDDLEAKVNQLMSTPVSPQPVPPSQAQPASLANGAPQAAPQAVDFLSIYSAVGVDPNSNDVIQLTRQHGNNPDALELALIRYQRAKASQPPAPASAIPAPSGSIGTGGKIDLTNIKDPAKLYEMARETGAKLPGRAG